MDRRVIPTVPCPVLVGRAAELEVLEASVQAAGEGRGGVVFVTGEAGIGKSRLAQEVSTTAAARGMRVLRGRAVPGSSAAAFRPLAEALAAVVPEAGLDGSELTPWLPALSAVVPALTSPASSGAVADATAAVRGEAVLRLLRSVCGFGGGVLVLEDLHWADPETMAVVEHLSDNLERAPVLCVVTVRDDEDSPARDLVRRVQARRSAPVLELRPLNDAQVAAMVHSCTGGVDAGTVDRVVELAEGIPFLIEEMLVSPGLPASMADGVAARLAQLPEADRRLLITAAAFGRHFDWRILATATGLSEVDVVDALDRGVRAQLLAVEGDGFRFRHALTAEAVYQSVIPPRRVAAAAAALATFDAVHHDVDARAREMAARLAERAGQYERAGELCLLMGDEALGRGALHTAVVALERAVGLLPPGVGERAARARLVAALASAGRVDDALVVGREIADRLPPAGAAAVHLRLAGAAITASRWDVARAQLAKARRLVESTTSAAQRAELALLEGELALGAGDGRRAEQHATAALEEARQEGAAEIECAALQLLGRCARQSSLATADAWFREALATAESHGLALWRLRALHEIGTIALLERSDVTTLLHAQAQAESVGAMGMAAILDVEIAAGYAGLHDLDAETRHGFDAVRRGTELGLGVVVAYGWHHVAAVAALRGDHVRVEEAAAAARAAAPGNRDIEGMLAGACDVVVALVAKENERARTAAQRCHELLRGSPTAPPAYFRAAWPLLLAVGRRREAPGAIQELERAGLPVARAARGTLVMARAVVAGRAEPGRAADLAADADRQLAEVPMWRALVRRLAADAAITDGWAFPDRWLTEAEQWLRQHGFEACRTVRGGPSTTVPPAWARFGITRREADVLALVIEGSSNRDIAARLYLSVRTVEKHVESLLRKTGTASRTQLARVAATT